MLRKEQLDVKPSACAPPAVRGLGRCACKHSLAAAHPQPRLHWMWLERCAVDLPVRWRRHLERLPQRLVPVLSVQHVAQHPKAEPSGKDPGGVGDVLEHKLAEDGPYRERPDE